VLRRIAISCLFAALPLSAAARTRPHYGGTLRVEIAGDAWQKGGLARRLVFDGLTKFATGGAVQPALAIEWQSENNNHRWQFRLRPSVHFQDGSPLTTTDVVTSLRASCAANCPWASVHALAYSVVFTSDSPMPNLPQLLAEDEFLITGRVAAEGNASHGPVGTGAFQVSGFSNGVLALAASDTCWEGRPFVDAVEIRVHREVRDQWLDLSMGRADLVEVPAEEMRIAQQQRLNVVSLPDAELLALEAGESGAWSNQNLRSAIALSIDRAALANVIFQKQGQAAGSLLPQSLSGYAFLFSAERELNRAHELRGGLSAPPLTLAAEGAGAMQLAAQRIALNLREAGFNVQVTGSPNADLKLRALPILGNAPAPALEVLLRAAGQPQTVSADNPAALYKTERDILERETLIPLLHLPRAWASSARVRDLKLRADDSPDLADASLEVAP
jgi:MarR-like DNA-binding transcriptional regulator SgrR of sgrS sRNA